MSSQCISDCPLFHPATRKSSAVPPFQPARQPGRALALLLILCAVPAIPCRGLQDSASSEKINLVVKSDRGARITARTDFEGSLFVRNEEKRTQEAVPLVVAASFKFDQYPAGTDDAIRRYEQATAAITLNGKSTENRLAETNRQLAVRVQNRKLTRPVNYLSMGGVLRQVEQELLLVPGDPLVFGQLFSRSGIEVGTRWTPENRAVQGFLALENIIDNRLELLVKEVTAETVKVYLMGDVRGEVDTAITDQHVVGVALIDRQSQTVQALRVTIDEKRQISQIAPGFAGQIKLDIRSTPSPENDPAQQQFRQVSGQKLQNLPMKLLWNSDSQFEMVYDPQWRVIVSDPDAVILRYVNQGSLLAQCSILRLPKRPADKPLQKVQFTEEITRLITESGSRIIGSDVAATRNGLNVIRVVVQGDQDGLPVEWRYFHVSSPDGRCIAMVVTAERESARALGLADLQLIESVSFPKPESNTVQTSQAERAAAATSSRRQ